MRVGLFQRLGEIGRSRRRQQPGCEELRDLLRQQATPRARRLRLPWHRCGRTDRSKWPITSKDCSWLKRIAGRFVMRTHNGQWHRDIGPCGAEHWRDHDEPLRNRAPSRGTSRIERSLRRSFPFSKGRRRCCGKFLFGLLNFEGIFGAPFPS